MALINCPECDNTVSSEAASCPKCGYVINEPPQQKDSSSSGFGCGCLPYLIVIGLLGYALHCMNESEPTTYILPIPGSPEARKEMIEQHFSSWDGSHDGLTKTIKKSMNNPDSYKHVQTSYSDNDNYLIVKTIFRGTNALGGIVTNQVTAKVDLDGNVIEILSQEP